MEAGESKELTGKHIFRYLINPICLNIYCKSCGDIKIMIFNPL